MFSTTDQHESAASAKRVEETKPRFLSGMKAICKYMGKSEGVVLKCIRQEGLPACKEGGGWVSDAEQIDQWRLQRIANKK